MTSAGGSESLPQSRRAGGARFERASLLCAAAAAAATMTIAPKSKAEIMKLFATLAAAAPNLGASRRQRKLRGPS